MSADVWLAPTAQVIGNYLDLVPKGRDEDGFSFSMQWLRRHDQY
jgi:predicted dithiol-disulfide oxidoreductase (DUF899 family)